MGKAITPLYDYSLLLTLFLTTKLLGTQPLTPSTINYTKIAIAFLALGLLALVSGRVPHHRSLERSAVLVNDSWPPVQGRTEYPAGHGGIKSDSAGMVQIVARAIWDPSKIATNELDAVHQGKGGWLGCILDATDENAGKMWPDPLSRTPKSASSQWADMLETELAKWAWKEADYDQDYNCDFTDGNTANRLGATMNALGLNAQLQSKGGDNVCYSSEHFDENAEDEDGDILDYLDQRYYVDGAEHACTLHVANIRIDQVAMIRSPDMTQLIDEVFYHYKKVVVLELPKFGKDGYTVTHPALEQSNRVQNLESHAHTNGLQASPPPPHGTSINQFEINRLDRLAMTIEWLRKLSVGNIGFANLDTFRLNFTPMPMYKTTPHLDLPPICEALQEVGSLEFKTNKLEMVIMGHVCPGAACPINDVFCEFHAKLSTLLVAKPPGNN
ncbi:hypothetical protein CC86DRAFT_407797 [Ophiobolus disseminans]|uniref:Uncharacterized protein n=1 Tax=Ophiobolus disseminans TaxID=1469910 RepID=A0A6A6ZU92_9PLEO|nr:hypothetical protein CC86DRAFT_407797 [Ophiobolus disseminans]